jgi:hypothetical protein
MGEEFLDMLVPGADQTFNSRYQIESHTPSHLPYFRNQKWGRSVFIYLFIYLLSFGWKITSLKPV